MDNHYIVYLIPHHKNSYSLLSSSLKKINMLENNKDER
jgi:hypothetical protein